ncbi:MAG: hypothetical protein K1X53_02690 [Candidatus Sumerlaeaceae bacterium]|nr:hypothetical protein [Candidatus Sumerlaeaceae bacterium]
MWPPQLVFKTLPNGDRCFYTGGPLSRPYIVKDEVTELRLLQRQKWLSVMIIVIVTLAPYFAFRHRPDGIPEALWLAMTVAIACTVGWVIQLLLFRKLLAGLERAPARMPLRAFYVQQAQQVSETTLYLFLALMAVLTLLFLLFSAATQNLIWGIAFTAIFLGIPSALFCYMLHLKGQGNS